MRPFGYHITGGAHVGSNLSTAVEAGYTAAQIFLGPPQRAIPSTISDEQAIKFVDVKKRSGVKVFVHAPYVLHAYARPENRRKNHSSIAKLINIAENLGCDGFVLHMGGTKWYENEDPLEQLGHLIDFIHGYTSTEINLPLKCPILLENCASGNNLSGDLETICELISRYSKISRTIATMKEVGLCLDTCHAWAWGHDLNKPEVMAKVIETVSPYIKLIHLNNAPEKVTCGGKYDRHASINEGIIDKSAFEKLLKSLPDVPVIVERDSHQDVIADWAFVKYVDSAQETS